MFPQRCFLSDVVSDILSDARCSGHAAARGFRAGRMMRGSFAATVRSHSMARRKVSCAGVARAIPRQGGRARRREACSVGMSRAQKRPPERPRPRGAEDTLLFRERLDAGGRRSGRRCGSSDRSLRVAGRHTARGQRNSKRPEGIHALGSRFAARRNGIRRPRCRPVHVESSCSIVRARLPGRRYVQRVRWRG